MENSPPKPKMSSGVSGGKMEGVPPPGWNAFVHHWSWKYFWNSPPRWPGWNGRKFHPDKISFRSMWGALGNPGFLHWPEVTLKDCDTSDTSPHYHWKKTTQQKKTAFLEICQRPLWVFSSHSLVEKKLWPLRGLTIVPVWAATHGSVLLEIFKRRVYPPKRGEKCHGNVSMEAFTIGGYISCWACCWGK